MSARLATQIEQARRRVEGLEFSLSVYAGFPGAAAKVRGDLDAARQALAELEAGR